MGYAEYYLYLLKISWPALSALIVVYFFLGIRVINKIRSNNLRSSPKNFALVALSLAALVIYTHMFGQNFGDWFQKPSLRQGTVVDLQEKGEPWTANKYYLLLESEGRVLTLNIDQATFKKLRKHDLLQVNFLPLKKEVFRCQVLTRQAEDHI